MNAVATPQPYEVPEGGLGSFLTATVGDWSDEALNADNYYDIVKPTAEQLAEFGREEDDRIAHVATGETVVPMAVFEEDPALKEALFARMRDMGIEPERYVVGNELNSINPVTGQPEFFLKKIFKGIKKAVKGVVKVFKKIAPIVLSIGLSFIPGVGPILAGTLGGGIGTLIQGGSLKDALKGALIGGAMGGLSSGIGSVLKGGEFMAGVKAGLPTGLGGGVNPTLPTPSDLTSKLTEAVPDYVAPELPASELVSTAPAAAGTPAAATGAQPLSTGVEPPAFMTPSDALPAAGTQPLSTGVQPPPSGSLIPQDQLSTAFDATSPGAAAKASTGAPGVAAKASDPTQLIDTVDDALALPNFDAVAQAADPGLLTSLKNFFTQPNKLDSLKDIFLSGKLDPTEMQKLILNETGRNVSYGVAKELAKELAPNLLRTYGPLGFGGLALTGAMGGFEPGAPPEPYDFFAGMDRTPYQFAAPGSQFKAAAGGGEMTNFPRKNGAIYGPGTETSDDIPAMLSDGEFVMTARAVRGAGNGSRQDGMKRMYDMMRTFEGRAARG